MTADAPVRVELGAGSVDLVRGTVTRGDGAVVQLTTRECDLLRHLVQHPSRTVARDELLAHVWGYQDTVVSRACDNAVRRLREKIELDPAQPEHVLTVHGTGYRFEPRPASSAGVPSEASATPGSGAATPATPCGPSLGEIALDLPRHRLVGPEGPVDLTAIEVALLERLVRAEGAVVDRAALLRDVWNAPRSGTRTVDSGVRRLRQKLEPDPTRPRFLITARGGGYRLAVPSPPVLADDGPLIGRNALVAATVDALASHRWVLLLGPGGIGKTRVARRVAATHRAPIWVDLASAESAEDVLVTIGTALGVDLSGRDLSGRIGRTLGARPGTLLVLDNLDRVAELAAPLVGTWRRELGRLTMLGTSRVRLDVDGEQVVDVGPLDEDAGIALFVQRAVAASPAFRRHPAGDPAVRELVLRLEGVPLAVELAAARTPMLSPADLLARLDLDLLSRPRALDPRHRSLRASIEATWTLLDDEDRAALLQLSLFHTGFDVIDAEGVLGPLAVDRVQALRDRSVLQHVVQGPGARETQPPPVRLRPWEAIREFAVDRRAGDPEDRERVLRHLRWLARLACTGRERETDGQIAAVEELGWAVRAGVAIGEADLAFRCAQGAWWVWSTMGPVRAALAVLDGLAACPGLDGAQQATVLGWTGKLYRLVDDVDRATTALEETVRLGELHDAHLAVAEAATELALAARDRLQWEVARGWFARAGSRYRLGGDVFQAELMDAAIAMLDGDTAPAEAAYTRQLRVVSKQGNQRMVAHIQEKLGSIAAVTARPAEARTRFEAALRARAEARWRGGRSRLLLEMLVVMFDLGDHAGVDRTAAESLANAIAAGSPLDEAATRSYWARSLLVRGRFDEAREHLWFARGEFAKHDRPMPIAFLDVQLAEVALASGDPAEAQRLARRGAEAAAEMPTTRSTLQFRTMADTVLGLAQAALGDRDGAQQRLERALEGVPAPSPAYVAVTSAALGWVAAQRGDRERAVRALAEATQAAVELGLDRPGTPIRLRLDRLRTAIEGAGWAAGPDPATLREGP